MLPSDLPKLRGADALGSLGEAVEGIVGGRLRETIYRRGGVSYRWDFNLPLQGEEFRLHRTDVWRLLRCFWRRRRKTTVSYSAYEAPTA